MRVFNPKPYILKIDNLYSRHTLAPLTRGLFHEIAPKKQQFEASQRVQGKYGTVVFPTFVLDDEFDQEYNCPESWDSSEKLYYYSMRRLYLEAEDPHEYTFAQSVLGSWDHWLKLLKSKPILKKIEDWREELSTRLASKGVKSIIKKTLDGDVAASKFMATKSWQKTFARVTKDEENPEAQEINKDFERLKLVSSR